MQKKLIALAIAGIAAVPAFAQSNVTVYGRVDYGYMTRNGDSGGVTGTNSRAEFAPGLAAGSRIGFKGTEDLGNGLKAIFEVETGIQNDEPRASSATSSGGLFSTNRHSYVGLTGNFGTVVGGRLDGVRYGIFNKYDAFGGGNMGNFTQMTIQVDRANNAVAYISPTFGGGFNVVAAYASASGIAGNTTEGAGGGNTTGNQGDGKLNTLNLNYNNGPISAAIDWEQIKQTSDGLAGAGGKHKVATVAGSYDFGMVKLAALWDSHKSDFGTPGAQSINYRDYFLSAKVPFAGKFTGKITWGKFDNKLTGAESNDATKWGLGLNYDLSKRTSLYADYGKIKNKSAAAIQISPLANSLQGGYGVKGFDLGIAHNF